MNATMGWKATSSPAAAASHWRRGASSRTVRKAQSAARPASSADMSRTAVELAEGAPRVRQEVCRQDQPVVAGQVSGGGHEEPAAVVLAARVLPEALAVPLLVGRQPRRLRVAQPHDRVGARGVERHDRAARERPGAAGLLVRKLALLAQGLEIGEVVGLVRALPGRGDQRPRGGVHDRDKRHSARDSRAAPRAGARDGERAERDQPQQRQDQEEDDPVPPGGDDPGAEQGGAIEGRPQHAHDRGPLVRRGQQPHCHARLDRLAGERRLLLVDLNTRRPAHPNAPTLGRDAQRAVHALAVGGASPIAITTGTGVVPGAWSTGIRVAPVCALALGPALHDEPRPRSPLHRAVSSALVVPSGMRSSGMHSRSPSPTSATRPRTPTLFVPV